MIYTEFDSLTTLNQYYASLFEESDELIKLTPSQLHLHSINPSLFSTSVQEDTLHIVDESFITNIDSNFNYLNYTQDIYLYKGSKTKFFNSVLKDLVPSLRKNFLNFIVQDNYLKYTSTVYTLVVNCSLPVEAYISCTSNSEALIEALSTAQNKLSSVSSDEKYLLSKIKELTDHIKVLNKEIDNLNSRLQDSYLSTWN